MGDGVADVVLDEDEVVLVELDAAYEGKEEDCGEDGGAFHAAGNVEDGGGGKVAEGHVPHGGVSEVHAVADIDHHGATEENEQEEEDALAVIAAEGEYAANGGEKHGGAEEHDIDNVPEPRAAAGLVGKEHLLGFGDEELVGEEEGIEIASERDEHHEAEEAAGDSGAECGP